MENLVEFNKEGLIRELKELHKELVDVYSTLFIEKYSNCNDFKQFVDKEYIENGVSERDKKEWNQKFCHKASYTLINKILFIKICEDKDFMLSDEDIYATGEKKSPNAGKKLSGIGYQKWTNLITNYTLSELLQLAFKDMSISYPNILLYKHDKYEQLNPKREEREQKFVLNKNDYNETIAYKFEVVLDDVINRLDKPEYNFKIDIKGNVLGDVYEKFLDKDTRKALGQFYTPDFVIDYILESTLKHADVLENPFIKVADISCGSGHFLISAYDLLRIKFQDNIEELRKRYKDNEYQVRKNRSTVILKGNEYWREEYIHYHILKHCIYGADIDDFAVQLTTINLLLKDLDNITDELNIIQCDSLIRWEKDYDWQDLKKQLTEEFTVVKHITEDMFGNKVVGENIKIRDQYSLKHINNPNLIDYNDLKREEAEDLLKVCDFWNIKYDYVIGNPPYAGKFSDISKETIKKSHFEIVEGNFDLYVFFIKRAIDIVKDKKYVSYIVPNTWLQNIKKQKLRGYVFEHSNIDEVYELAKKVFFDAPDVVPLIFKLKTLSEPNSENKSIVKLLYAPKGIYNPEIGLSRYYGKYINEILWRKQVHKLINLKIDDNFIIIKEKIEHNSRRLDTCFDTYTGNMTGEISKFVKKEKLTNNYFPTLSGRNIEKYGVKWNGEFLNYCNELQSMTPKEILEQNKVLFQGLRKMSMKVRLVCTMDKEGYYVLNTLGIIVCKNTNKNISLEYLLGILNSRLMNYWFTKTYTDMHIYLHHINSIPIKIGDADEIKNVTTYVNNMVEAKQRYLEGFDYKYLTNNDSIAILQEYVRYKKRKELNKITYNDYDKKLDYIIMKIYGVEEEQYALFCEECGETIVEKSEDIDYLQKKLNANEFIEEHIMNNLDIEAISRKYSIEELTVYNLREKYILNYSNNEPWKFLNLSELNDIISNYIVDIVINILCQHKKYITLDELYSIFETKIMSFNEVIKVIKYNDFSKRAIDILKDIVNAYCDTWNSYRKNKQENKEGHKVIKYDNNVYGLPGWDDEIHKDYFLDNVNEYVLNKPSKQKAEGFLKIFKELDIEYKDAYVNEIEKSMKKAFS